MMRYLAMVQRVLKELIRDKRTLALMILAPMLILTLMNIVFDANGKTHVKIGLDSSIPATIVDAFPKDSVKVKEYNKSTDEKKVMLADDLDAFISLDETTFHLTYENDDPSNTAKIKALFTNILTTTKLKELTAEMQQAAATSAPASYNIESSYVFGSADSTFFDKIFPILIGFFIFFFVFLISGIALLKERTSGTLERLLATPVKRSEIIFGYSTGYGIFAIFQTILIVLFALYVLKIEIVGSLLWVLIVAILLALVALTLGIFVSTFAASEFQMIQFIPVVVIPQVFFSGIIPLDSMASWVKNISYIFPLSYAGDALTDVMLKGQGFFDIWWDLLILALFIIAFTCLNIFGLKRYRKV